MRSAGWSIAPTGTPTNASGLYAAPLPVLPIKRMKNPNTSGVELLAASQLVCDDLDMVYPLVRHRLDLFGVLVLAFAAANTGGITRDLLIGVVPPAAISDWRYLAVSLLAGVTFWRPSVIARLRSPVLIFDAAGLALFAVAGTQKALAFGLHPVMAALF